MESVDKESTQYQDLANKKEQQENTLELIKSLDPEDLLNRTIANDPSPSDQQKKLIETRIMQPAALNVVITQLQHFNSTQLPPTQNKENVNKKKKETKKVKEQSKETTETQQNENTISQLSESEENEENSAESFDSSKDLGVTEGFTITVPNFGEAFSDSEDSDVAAIEIRDHYSDAELDDAEYDEDQEKGNVSDSNSISGGDDESDSSSDTPPPKVRKTSDKQTPSAKKPKFEKKTTPKPAAMEKKKKKKNRPGQSTRRRLAQSQETFKGSRNPSFAKKPAPNPSKPAPTEDTESLHPSWSARKKATNIAEFKGKKVTFGDDSD